MYVQILEQLDFPEQAIELLAENGFHVLTPVSDTELGDVDILFVRLAYFIGPDLLKNYSNLKYIVSPTTGTTHINMDYLDEHSIHLISLKGHSDFLKEVHATAEHTICLMLSIIRRMPVATYSVGQNQWSRYGKKGKELNGKRVLIIGHGRVGSQVKNILSAFGCIVTVHDIDQNRMEKHDVNTAIEDKLSTSDIVSLHLDYNQSNYHFFNCALISKMKEGAYLINTSRGEVLDLEFALKKLQEKFLSGIALDVLEGEPNPSLELLNTYRDLVEDGTLLVTPHIAGYTHESLEKVEVYVTNLLLEKCGTEG